MSLNHYWESFIRKLKGKPGSRDNFENLMLELLKAEYPEKEVHRVASSPGDGGIDILVQQDNGIDIYQCKFFTDELSDSQRNQIRKSFNKAMEDKGVTVLRWFLCMPREQELEEISWVHNFIKKRSDNYGVEIHFIYGTEITNLMEAVAPNLIEKYFTITPKKIFTNKALIVPLTKSNSNCAQGGTYIPRDDLLDKIANCFGSQIDGKRIVFLSGMGGCGKSELARAYADKWHEKFEDIFWLTCQDGVTPNFKAIMSGAKTLCDVQEADVVGFSDHVLIIVDNYNLHDEEFMNELMNGTGAADVIVTTRLGRIGSFSHQIIPVESDDPHTFGYSVFEKNYSKPTQFGEIKKIEENEIKYVHDICKKVHYNTMFISLIAVRLREYNNLTIIECSKKIRIGIGAIKGKIDFSKDQKSRTEEMNGILRFLFSDILTHSFSDDQKSILTLLSLSPATWYEYDYILSLMNGSNQDTEFEYAIHSLLTFGWLQGNNKNIALHPLIAEVISDQSIQITDSLFFSGLLKNYLGLPAEFLNTEKHLINKILQQAIASSEEIIAVMLLLCDERYKAYFEDKYPAVNVAYFVYVNHAGERHFLYRNLETNTTHSLLSIESLEEESTNANLLSLYNSGISYKLDLSVAFYEKMIAWIPPGLCYKDQFITGVTFNTQIITISDAAFYDCNNLNDELYLPDGLLHIEDMAFFQCNNLHGNLHLPDTLISIGFKAFSSCSSLSGQLILPKKLEELGGYAFYGCENLIGNLHLPDSLSAIGDGVFWGCKNLDGVLHLPDRLTDIGDGAFLNCNSLSGELNLPETLTSIGVSAFWGCHNLCGELHLPIGVKRIGDNAFRECSMLEGALYLPDNLTDIGADAFRGCHGLQGKLHIPKNLVSISNGTFSECDGLSGKLCLPEKIIDIGDNAFYSCNSLSGELRLPDGLSNIGHGAFYGCSGLSGKLRLPSNIRHIGECAFYGCSGLEIDDETTNQSPHVDIEPLAFSGCENTSIKKNLSNNITENYCIHKSSDEILRFISTLAAIVDYAFANKKSLTGSLIFSNNLSFIGNCAFRGCNGLSGELLLPAGLTHIGSFAFLSCTSLCGDLHIPNSVTSIGEGAFENCSGLNGELHLPENLITIHNDTFWFCSQIKGELLLPKNISAIGEHAFWGCSSFSGELHLPESINKIGAFAFRDCSKFSGKLLIPDGLSRIENGVFFGCSGLNGELILPSGLLDIGNCAFDGCHNISGKLQLPNGLKSIGVRAFAECYCLSGELCLPESLTRIDSFAFEDCRGFIGELHLPNSLTFLGSSAFSGCLRINKIIFHNQDTKIEGTLIPYASPIICGYKHSTAEEYARYNGLIFEELNPAE